MNELPGATAVVPLSADLISADHDVNFVVDTASPMLLGGEPSVREALLQRWPVVNIDHHDSNQQYGVSQLCGNRFAAATAEVLWGILTEARHPADRRHGDQPASRDSSATRSAFRSPTPRPGRCGRRPGCSKPAARLTAFRAES